MGESACIEGREMETCTLHYLLFLIHVSALCSFPCDISKVEGKKATKQCNGDKDLQHGTTEMKEV